MHDMRINQQGDKPCIAKFYENGALDKHSVRSWNGSVK